ncbi:MAG: TolC family outer membrane protein [Hydrogenophilus sp.]
MKAKQWLPLLLSSVCAGWFASVHAEPLETVLRWAEQNDPVIAAARAARAAGKEKEVQGRALLLPSLGASADTFWNRVEIRGFEKHYNTNQWGVKLTQPLYRPQNWAQAKQAELQSELAELQWRDAEQQLVLRVAKAWFDVLTARAQLQAAEELRAAAEGQLKLAKASFEVGTVTVVDVYEAQSRYDLAEAQVVAAKNRVAVAEAALVSITGQAPQRYPRLKMDVKLLPPEPAELSAWEAAARADNLAVLQAQVAERITKEELARRRAGHQPTVDLEAMVGNQRLFLQSSFSSADVDAAQIGVRVTIPLYAGGAITSQVREGAALLTQAQRNRDAAERQAVLATKQAYLNVTNGLTRVKALEAALASSLKNLEATKTGFEVGVRINLDVLNAQAQVADARTQLAQARFDTLLALLQLKAAAGQLAASDLAQVDALFEEE